MLKQPHSTESTPKRRLQVALDLPPEVEQRLRQEAAGGFRCIAKEIAMRLVQSVRQQGAQA